MKHSQPNILILPERPAQAPRSDVSDHVGAIREVESDDVSTTSAVNRYHVYRFTGLYNGSSDEDAANEDEDEDEDTTKEDHDELMLQETDIEDLHFRALMSLSGKNFGSLEVIKNIIRNLTGIPLVDVVREAIKLSRNDFHLSQLDRMDTENRGVANCDLLRQLNQALPSFLAMPVIAFNASGDEKMDAWETIIGALQYLLYANEEDILRKLLRSAVNFLDGKTAYGVFARQIWTLPEGDRLNLGYDAMGIINTGDACYPDEEEEWTTDDEAMQSDDEDDTEDEMDDDNDDDDNGIF